MDREEILRHSRAAGDWFWSWVCCWREPRCWIWPFMYGAYWD